ncbi:hypothetical protein ACFL5P_02875, partial [candidate division KSB1 bacterium]
DSIQHVQQDLNIHLYAPEVLPAGFSLVKIAVVYREDNVPRIIYDYSDGLIILQMYQRKTGTKERKKRVESDFISEIKNGVYLGFGGDAVNNVKKDVILKSFDSIKLVNEKITN